MSHTSILWHIWYIYIYIYYIYMYIRVYIYIYIYTFNVTRQLIKRRLHHVLWSLKQPHNHIILPGITSNILIKSIIHYQQQFLFITPLAVPVISACDQLRQRRRSTVNTRRASMISDTPCLSGWPQLRLTGDDGWPALGLTLGHPVVTKFRPLQ